MPKIGILGGMGPQASSRLYELIIEGTKQRYPSAIDSDFPAITLLNIPVPNFVSSTKNLAIAKKQLLLATATLEGAGCTINSIACNTAHILLPALQATTTVPFLSIPRLVADKVLKLGYKRVGLFATPSTLKSTIYDDELTGSIKLIRPSPQVTSKVERFIFKQLNSNITPADQQEFKGLVAEFMETKNLDAVILGCTELPLVFGQPTKRVIDSLRVLSDGLLDEYFLG